MRPCATTLASEITTEEMSFLLKMMTKVPRTGHHLEVGTAAGGTLWQMISAYADSARPPIFCVVDPMAYFPNQYNVVKKNLSDHGIDPNSVDFRVMPSQEALAEAKEQGETFDFIFIDAGHKVRDVMNDFSWSQLLNVGGMICLHDFCPKFRGVMMAAKRFLKKHPNYQVVGQAGTLLAMEKTAISKSPEVTFSDRLWALSLAPYLQLEPSIRKRFTGVTRLFVF